MTSPRRNLWMAAIALGSAGCGAAGPPPAPRPLSAEDREEVEIGDALDHLFLAMHDRYGDPALDRYLTGVGQRLARVSNRPELPWNFCVIDEPAAGAFSIMGGHVYVTRGMLAHLRNEAELAGIVAHEIAHIERKHGRDRLSDLRDVNPWTGAEQLAAWSRDEERSADHRAVELAATAGYDPHAVVPMFETLRRIQADAEAEDLVGMGDHPPDAARIARAARQVRDLPAGGNPFEAEYFAAIDGLVIGRDDRDGYFVQQRLVFPHDDLVVSIPKDLVAQTASGHVVATSPDRERSVSLLSYPRSQSAEWHEAFGGMFTTPVVEERRVAGRPVSLHAPHPMPEGTTRFAAIELGPRELGILVFARSAPAAADVLLDEVLATARVTTAAERNRAEPRRIVVERVDAPSTLTLFVETRCPLGGDLEQIGKLNQRAPEETLPVGQAIKCVR